MAAFGSLPSHLKVTEYRGAKQTLIDLVIHSRRIRLESKNHMESDTFNGLGVRRYPAEFVAIGGIFDGIETGKTGAAMLTDLAVRKAVARDRPGKLSDGGVCT